MDVHLRDLRYFVATAEELNVTRAAERLYVSQPALSKQLRALERQLGFALFDRVHSGMALTRQGEALLPTARQLLADWDGGLASIPSGMLVVGLQTAVGRGLQQRAMNGFRARMPGWEVSLRLVGWGDASAGLADGSSDVAFLWLPAPAGLETRVLATEPRGVILPEGHRLAVHRELEFGQLADEAFLALPREAGERRAFWLGGADVRVGATVSSAEETFEAIIGGIGIVIISEGNARLYARPGLVYRPVVDLAPSELALAWRRGDRRPQVRAFLETLT